VTRLGWAAPAAKGSADISRAARPPKRWPTGLTEGKGMSFQIKHTGGTGRVNREHEGRSR
jgi:hypothetical protein